MTSCIVLDLTRGDDDEALRSATAWIAEAERRGHELVLIIAEAGHLVEALSGADVVLMTVSVARHMLGDRWALAIQSASLPHILLVGAACAPTDDFFHDGGNRVADIPGIDAGEGRVFAHFDVEDYAAVRGFNTRIDGAREMLLDLFGRIASVTPRDTEDATGERNGPLFANLPVWPYRPFGIAPLVAVVILVEDGAFFDDVLSTVMAQSFDDLAVHVVDPSGSAAVADWVSAHRGSVPIRFGSLGSIEYHDLSKAPTDGVGNFLQGITSRYLFLLDGRDMLLPWAVETILKHLRSDVSGVTGIRILYDPNDGALEPTVDPDVPRTIMVDTRKLSTWDHRSTSNPTERVIASEVTNVLSGWQASPIATTLRAGPRRFLAGRRWRIPWSGDPVDVCMACLPDAMGLRDVIVRQTCVAKVDEIDGYDRIAGITAQFDGKDRPTLESCVIADCTWGDLVRLSRAGIAFELARPQGGRPGVGGAAGQELSRRLSSTLHAVDPGLTGGMCIGVTRTDAVGTAHPSSGNPPGGESDWLGWIYHREVGSTTKVLSLRALAPAEARDLAGEDSGGETFVLSGVPLWGPRADRSSSSGEGGGG